MLDVAIGPQCPVYLLDNFFDDGIAVVHVDERNFAVLINDEHVRNGFDIVLAAGCRSDRTPAASAESARLS